MSADLCPCGEALHYDNPNMRETMDSIVAKQGTHVFYPHPNHPTKGWSVPRHFVALHDPQDSEIEKLAERYGFEAV